MEGFHERPDALPIDDPEVLALLAPRPVLLVAPQRDRYASQTAVAHGVDLARQVYQRQSAENALRVERPLDYNRFPASTQKLVFGWLKDMAESK